jgi:hypothetical protein
MRSFFSSTLDVLGLIAVASLTVSVIIQSFAVVQPASKSTMRATTTHDSPEGFPLIDEIFVPSLYTTDNTEDVSTIRRINYAVQKREETTPIVPLLLDGRDNFSYSRNAKHVTTEDTTATPPSLHSLLHNETGKLVKGADVSWLLDFAIIGFGKCGTSTVRFV